MRKSHLLGTAGFGRRGWTPSEMRQGRMMRNPEGDHGGGGGGGGGGEPPAGGTTPQGGGDNPPVNPNPENPSGGGNTGQDFDLASFWTPGSDEQQTPNLDERATQAGNELGTQLLNAVKGFKANDVFTTESLEKMAAGDLTDLNNGLNTAFQTGMTQMLGMTAQMLKVFETHFQQRMESMMGDRITGAQSNQQDEKLLADNFAAFENPATRPLIQSVFARALKHSGNDRSKALELTKSMLQEMGKHGQKDFGFGNFTDPDNNLDEGPSRLVQELLQIGR